MTTYYVKNGGSDGLDGQSDANAWATLAKINSAALNAGDTVYLKRGSVWREPGWLYLDKTGTSGSPITIDAYGDGPRPLILGSLNKSSTSDWSDQGGNIWRTTSTVANRDGGNDVGIIALNGGTSFGFKRFYISGTVTASDNTTTAVNLGSAAGAISDSWNSHVLRFTGGTNSGLSRTITDYNGTTKIATVSDLPVACDGTTTYILSDITQQGDFYTPWHWPPTTADYVYMYSTTNPATYYPGSVELGLRQSSALLYLYQCSYVTVRNLEFRYFGRHGCCIVGSEATPSVGVIVENCKFSSGGGCKENNTVPAERSGSAVQFYGGVQNCHFRYNILDNYYESGLDIQVYTNNITLSGLYCYGNIVSRGTKGIEYLISASGCTVDDIKIVNNTFYNMGGGWANIPDQRTADWGNFTGAMLWSSAGTPGTSYIRNNIFHTLQGTLGFYIYGKASDDLSGFNLDYNSYYGNTQGWKRIDTTYGDIASWRTAASADTHSIISDPLISLGPNGRIHLASGSPCLNAGVAITGVNDTYIGSAPDIGFEGTQNREVDISMGTGTHKKVYVDWNA